MARLVLCLALLAFLDAKLIDSFNKTAESNAVACSKLKTQANCEKVGACIWSSDACSPDLCFEKTYTAADSCSNSATETCTKINGDTISFCVSASRVPSFQDAAAKCSLEWGEYKAVEYGLCKAITDCGPVAAIEVDDATYYVCGAGSPPVDPCNAVGVEHCTYIRDCMVVGESCVTDQCWERTLPGVGGCKGNCGSPHTISTGLGGYCKTPGHDLNNLCNAEAGGTKFYEANVGCKLLPDEAGCDSVVTVSRYGGSDLYVCNTEEFSIDAHAASLNSLAIAVSALILLVLML